MRLLIAIILVLAPIQTASARSMSGPAVAIDGDTLDMSGEHIRLFGIDAPEGQQACQRDNQTWNCGQEAKRLLSEMVAGKVVECEPIDRDAYSRTVARYYVGERELGAVLVLKGLAVTLSNGAETYSVEEATSKRFKLGLWGSVFQTPAEYRAANPRQFAQPAKSRAMPARNGSALTQSVVWFRNCADARAAGAAPLYRGQPGYRPEMDGDGDGVACEPFRGRR